MTEKYSTLARTYTSQPNDADPNDAPVAFDAATVVEIHSNRGCDFFVDHDLTGGTPTGSLRPYFYDASADKPWIAGVAITGVIPGEFYAAPSLANKYVYFRLYGPWATGTVDSDHPITVHVRERD
jgi:hypothetical protein